MRDEGSGGGGAFGEEMKVVGGACGSSTVVSHKYMYPFATLASVRNAGGAYVRDAKISLAITPPFRYR